VIWEGIIYMRCDLCNGTRCIVIGSISFKSKPLGTIIVPSVRHSKCSDCGDISIDYNESTKINEYIQKKEREAISSLPIKDFVSTKEAYEILNISKQAFSKNSRIQRGFIYAVTIDDKKFYYIKSVEEFKRTGKDGRINIHKQASASHTAKPSEIYKRLARSTDKQIVFSINPRRNERGKQFIRSFHSEPSSITSCKIRGRA